jgi:uncharacterized protein (TIGR02145 family)
MNKKNRQINYSILVLGFVLILASSCKKDETTSKKDPIITWANPADISFGSLLSETQLNATADVPGTYVYTPPIGTKLNEGANQDMKVEFIPTDAAIYNTTIKTVKINVIASTTVTDFDGNVYNTLTIGTQVWMTENLNTTHYRNGDSIANIIDNTQWINSTTGAFCNYNNDTDNAATYGRLYNWYTLLDNRNLAPKGWHIPSESEWQTLISYLGGSNVAGSKMKELGTVHWTYSNPDETNSSGFTALPGGHYSQMSWRVNYFTEINSCGFWWSTTDNALKSLASGVKICSPDNSVVITSIFKQDGLSVRCIKD